MFEKVLIANRGEIALRIHRACREMGIKTVAVHSTADAHGDECPARRRERLHRPAAGARQLSERRRRSCRRRRSPAPTRSIPGSAFSSENADFAAAVEEHGFTFIGPSPEHIRLMGDKVRAKAEAQRLGIPTVPGSADALRDIAAADGGGAGDRLSGAAQGGGGRRRARHEAGPRRRRAAHACCRWRRPRRRPRLATIRSISSAISTGRGISRSSCSATASGGVIHLGERDCSLQRSHQKLLEETPSPGLDRGGARAAARPSRSAALKKLGYKSAGTIEFLYQDGEFYFIEMNTRLQVEHPISEMVSGIDIVREQLRIAAGEPLGYRQSDIASARPRDRVPHQRREPGRFPALAGPDQRVSRAGRARHPRRQRGCTRATRCRPTTTA